MRDRRPTRGGCDGLFRHRRDRLHRAVPGRATCMKRGQPIYVLVRKGSLKKLDALREEWGDDRQARDRGRRRPREEEPRRLRRGHQEAQGQGRAHVPPRGDLRHQGDARKRSRTPTSTARGMRSSSRRRVGRRLLPSRELDRRRRPLRRRVPRGHVRRGRRPRPPVLQDQARLGSASCATNASGRSASTGPASSSATRRPATSTRSTGRTTSSRCCRRCATLLPPWVPMLGIEGGRINIVPVDFVADALDYLAHKKGLDGKCFHLTDPAAAPHRRSAQHLRQGRARAADDDAPQRAHVRLHSRAGALRHRLARAGQAHGPRGADTTSASRKDVFQFINWPTRYDNREAAKALKGSGIEVPKLEYVRGEAVGLLGAPSRSGPVHRPQPVRPRQGQGGRRHRRLVGHRQGDGDQARGGGRQGDPRRARRGEARRDQAGDRGRGRQVLDVHRRHRRPRVVRRAGRARAEGARHLPLPREQRGPLDPSRRHQFASTASTTSSGRCSSTTSARCASSWASCRR